MQVIYQSVNLYVYCLNDPLTLTNFLGAVAGEHFATMDDLLKDWGWNYFGVAEYTYFEHGSVIYMAYDENGNLYYSYTEEVFNKSDSGSVIYNMDAVPKGAEKVALIHTHPIYNDALYRHNGNSMFSDADRSTSNKTRLPIYVLNNNLGFGFDMYRYDPYAGESIVMRAQHYYRLTRNEKDNILRGQKYYSMFWYSSAKNPNSRMNQALKVAFGITAKDLVWPNPYVWGGYYG